MTVTTAPATVADLAALSGVVTRGQWRLVRELAAAGDTYALHAGAELVGLAFFLPIAPGAVEVNFNVAPSSSRHMLGIVRAARLTIDAAPYRQVVTVCRSKAGQRFAALVGFSRAGVCELGEIWIHGFADGAGGQDGGGVA